ncbi:MAG: HAD-IA family hydrolase, partial [Spirochaetota bacterium]|nr:HAD-IA family hydrolase [Spirochaetota bacterium]
RFPSFDNFDGGVISFEVKLNKPDRRIYDSLLLKYNLDPGETLFIDDIQENITAAEELGIQGIHYSSNINLELELGKIV